MKNPKWIVLDLDPTNDINPNRFIIIPPNTEFDDEGIVAGEFTDIENSLDWVSDTLEHIITKALNEE